ncbi:hypothetical protein LPJ78_002291 [Coemansia sp. RSA 989]|nr:hypothetical protein LPJ68_004082 [Coemansia sp. RSA 1086]KAJ1749082.1 hypothetical protein LPJ79_004010 [Coemansia sp. RSA 1821]KAJ1865891.1 hypothetical protein LPJ78_002291 [Coemansia sp. RSA 989]KAJ1873036.1 hypothetical protein LPJ55_002598 [Coemansia sp. RSA 990]KAJ2673371.1 hypothetical protein IWW42_002381 [Coemansia sp. RSA 1085]
MEQQAAAGKLTGLGFGSAFPQPGDERKTAVGRAGVMEYRRHSVDMGLARGAKRAAESDSEGSTSPAGRGVATADKPYACDQCELTFSRQHNLKSHALTHSTERPFACAVCQTQFRRQHDLKRHMKLHTGEKPYKCSNCGRCFARLDALNRHMRAENFHACSQAKKARTHDGRMLERRASHNPPGVAAAAHWTHRPSIAADEAMLRRMHARFGAPPPAHSQAQTQAQAPPLLPPIHRNPPKPRSPHPDTRYARADRPAWQPGPMRALPPLNPPQQQQPHIRLPPIELAPPRRHSLAVTSHLDRYRAADATPPPPQQPQKQSQPQPPQQPQQQSFGGRPQQMEPLPEDHEPASFAMHPTLQRVDPAHSAALQRSDPAYPPSLQRSDNTYPISLPQRNEGAFTLRPVASASEQMTFSPSRPDSAFTGTMRADAAFLSPVSAAGAATPPTAPVGDAMGSRRSSLARTSPLIATETRRSSIIALTNPPTEEEMRQENAELRRRLDEMEARYSREVERLNASVHELEIEKTLLKNMLLEKGASVPASPSTARIQKQSPPQQHVASSMPRSAP